MSCPHTATRTNFQPTSRQHPSPTWTTLASPWPSPRIPIPSDRIIFHPRSVHPPTFPPRVDTPPPTTPTATTTRHTPAICSPTWIWPQQATKHGKSRAVCWIPWRGDIPRPSWRNPLMWPRRCYKSNCLEVEEMCLPLSRKRRGRGDIPPRSGSGRRVRVRVRRHPKTRKCRITSPRPLPPPRFALHPARRDPPNHVTFPPLPPHHERAHDLQDPHLPPTPDMPSA